MNIHLFGSPAKDFDEHALNMVWLYSHPDMVTIENLRQFDYIFLRFLPFPAETPCNGIFKR